MRTKDGVMDGRCLRMAGQAAMGLALLLLSSGATCTNRAPTSDETPPIVKWTVHNNVRGGTQELTGDATVEGREGDTFTVTSIVEDPEGVRRISLGDRSTWTCLSPEGARVFPRDRGIEAEEFEEDSNGRVWTKIVRVRRVTFRSMTCDAGYTLSEGSVTLTSTGENFFGGSAAGELVISR